MDPHRRLSQARAALGALALLAATPASAQLFSPGPLAKAHAKLEGLDNCLKCHEPGNKLSNARCLDCHEVLRARVQKKKGFHGRLPSGQACAKCHREHRGLKRSLIDWGAGGQSAFDHGRTGFALRGAHKKQECKACHERPRIVDADVRKLDRSPTFLGLSARCARCHFDEHRGQLGADCKKCHAENAFKPAPGFDHDKTDFRLTGRHKRVKCASCHESSDDNKPAAGLLKPVSRTFAQYADVAHGSCVDCHLDKHRGQFGRRCTRCHTTQGWKRVKASAQDTGFHDKTAFPLRGEHADVDCKTCHGPFRGVKAVFKGLKHEHCSDCHVDAHAGQLEATAGTHGPDCKRCHGVTGFEPSTFDETMHAKTRYPLEGGHRAVPCAQCHKKSRRVARRFPAAGRAWLKKRKRPVVASGVQLKLPKATERCESCHTDPHASQFAAKVKSVGCNACHETTSFTDVSFDHQRDSRFALDGAHRRAACGSCHRRDDALQGAVRYRPIEPACAGCHADVHAAQFVSDGKRADCARCHTTEQFARTRFDHNDEAFTRFTLRGRHAAIECARCHPRVEVAAGVEAAWYRGVPQTCAGCHEDQHGGRFDSFVPSGGETGCAACHAETAWLPSRFAHERTGFPLRAAHQRTECASCHDQRFEQKVPVSCASCHRDVHAQQFGLQCSGCHDEDSWRPRFDVTAHRASGFPLSGRHASIPCEECHRDRRDRTFSRVAVSCATCHTQDLGRAATRVLDHLASRVGTSCRDCHSPVSFTPAALPQHEPCFPIARSAHRGVSCAQCHAGARGLVATGRCRETPVSCTSCHEHRCEVNTAVHDDVPGYACADTRCIGCHR
jgi:hypothetical protein